MGPVGDFLEPFEDISFSYYQMVFVSIFPCQFETGGVTISEENQVVWLMDDITRSLGASRRFRPPSYPSQVSIQHIVAVSFREGTFPENERLVHLKIPRF